MRYVWMFLALMLILAPLAQAQDNDCDPGEEPDVIVGNLMTMQKYGVVGDITAFSIGTESCNIGTCQLIWFGGSSSQHPVIAQNMFRLKDGRFEQIGQSWLKHGFSTLNGSLCSNDCIPTNGTYLGVNCSDPYWASLNGSQPGLGPKSDINPRLGTHNHPYTDQGQSGNVIYKRLQLHHDDIDPVLNAGALYFGEGQYVTADDAAAGNNMNNNSYRPAAFTGAGGNYNVSYTGPTVQQLPAIFAWEAQDPQVDIQWIQDEFVGASRVTDLGGGMWHYEYAIQNVLSDRAAGRFRVPLPHGVTITNVGFHDVDYHGGESYDGTDWAVTIEAGSGPNHIEWSTDSFDTNPDANALRWSTLYNFRFDADVAPDFSELTRLGLFAPGSPAEYRWITAAPDRCGDAFCEGRETVDNCSADCAAGGSGAGEVPDGDDPAGQPLTLALEPNGDLALAWGDSCRAADSDYEIYEGLIGNFSSHTSKVCSTGGVTADTITPAAASSYYLVVPSTGSLEGGYGTDSQGNQRPAGIAACMPQSIEACR